MLFTQLFNNAEAYIQVNIKNRIIINHTNHDAFRLWLKHEAKDVFAYIYQKEFAKQFRDYINDEITDQLAYAGKTLMYAITAFIRKEQSVEEILRFVEEFITEQLDAFDSDFNIDWVDEYGIMKPMDNPT
jgi:hypothetical protein